MGAGLAFLNLRLTFTMRIGVVSVGVDLLYDRAIRDDHTSIP